jgi:peptide/nickel transport system substrate-binding protein
MQEPGMITIALAARAPGGLNPQQSGLTGGDNWTIYQLFNTLVRAPDGRFATRPEEFEPSLAESWESTPDAKTWTYHLRKGVQFHKGYGEMTSEDVMFTFGRQLNKDLVTNGKVQFSNIESIEAPDAYTFIVKLKRPDPLFNGSAASVLAASIMSKKAFEEKGEEAFSFDPSAPAATRSKASARPRALPSPSSPTSSASRRRLRRCGSRTLPTQPRAPSPSLRARST